MQKSVDRVKMRTLRENGVSFRKFDDQSNPIQCSAWYLRRKAATYSGGECGSMTNILPMYSL